MNIDDINIVVAPRNGRPTRVVIARWGDEGEHRSTFNTDSDTSREKFLSKLAAKAKIEDEDELAKIDRKITMLADTADAEADAAEAVDASCGDESERKSQATQLVELAIAAGVELFHDPDSVAYARFAVDNHREVARIASGQFKRWLARLYFDSTGKAPNSQAKTDAASVLDGKALYDGDERPVHVRVAEHDGRIYLDLCNADWQAVEIDSAGWRVVSAPPVMFRRAKAMLPLPVPVSGGTIDELRKFIDTEPTSFMLIVAWLIAAVRPRGPYPVLVLDGEQGSGKSTRARMLRSLIDPNSADLRSEPREPRDLMIAASNGHIVALDNLSHLSDWLSDCLCRLATGGGFSTRTLYENDEETIFNATRPAILTGIEQVASRGDLIDRGLLVSLPAIPEEKRLPEADLWTAFGEARPRLLGVVLTSVSAAIKNLPTTRVSSLPRMADFALWITAAESALGWEPGAFMAAYAGNRDEADYLAIESSVIGKALMELLTTGNCEGTATELMAKLEDVAQLADKKQKPKRWPGNARALSGELSRIAPHLRKVGYEVESWRERGGKRTRRIAIRAVRDSCDLCVPSVSDPEKHGETWDASVPTGTQGSAAQAQTHPQNPSDGTQKDGKDAKPQPLPAGEDSDEEVVEWR